MNKEVKDSWRLIVTTLNNYGLYELMKNDIKKVADELNKENKDE